MQHDSRHDGLEEPVDDLDEPGDEPEQDESADESHDESGPYDDELDDEDELAPDDDELEDEDEPDEDDELEDEDEPDEDEFDDDELEPGAQADDLDDDLGAEETDFSTVATGSSIEAAKRTALDQLRKIVPYVREDGVEFLVMEEGHRGFLGMGGRKAVQVEARLRPAAMSAVEPGDEGAVAQDVGSFLRTAIGLMGLEADVTVTDDGESVVAELAGPDLGILIGRHGQTIDALQYVTMIAANRSHKARRRVVVDAEGYRERREVSLHAIADRTAQRVARDRAPITLKPMTAAERKVIHLRLKDHPRVQTSSEGQEPNRAVVIEPRTEG